MKYIVGLWYDVDLENPVDNDSNWRLIDFRNGAPDDVLTVEVKERVERGDAWMIIRGTADAPSRHATVVSDANCVWSLAKGYDDPHTGVLFWTGTIEELSPSRQEREVSARALLKEYSDWCNGSGYSYRVEAESTCPACHLHPRVVVAEARNYYDVAVDYMCDEIRQAIAIHAASSVTPSEIEIEVEGNAMWLREFHDFVPQPA